MSCTEETTTRLWRLELFHFFNGKRPAFYTLMFKERMTGEVRAQGEHYVLTENEEGYQLLLFVESAFQSALLGRRIVHAEPQQRTACPADRHGAR